MRKHDPCIIKAKSNFQSCFCHLSLEFETNNNVSLIKLLGPITMSQYYYDNMLATSMHTLEWSCEIVSNSDMIDKLDNQGSTSTLVTRPKTGHKQQNVK